MDVILFDVDYLVDDVLKETFNYQTRQRMEDNMTYGTYHRPAQRHPIKRELAAMIEYKDINFGEDTDFAKRIEPLLKTSKKIEKSLYRFRFSKKTSATCQK